jgi:hypothetical protein
MKAPIVLYEPPKRQRTDCRVGLPAWTDKSMLEELEARRVSVYSPT